MIRFTFTFIAITLVVSVTGSLAAQETNVARLDSFGGIVAMEGNKTGAFHIENIQGRDCLVTPDGHGFLSLGVNHIQAIIQPSAVDLFSTKFSMDWAKYSDATHQQLLSLGFNTAGYGCPQPLRKTMPFMADSFLLKNSNFLGMDTFTFPDVFDPQVQQQMKNKLRFMVSENKGNPNLIGYYWTDTPQWDLQRAKQTRGINWVMAIRELPADAPGKRRYDAYLENCKTVGTTASDEGFLRLIAREYYQVVGTETRRLDSNSLVFGERYLVNDHPDCVLEEAMPFIDVLSIQPGGARFLPDYLDGLYAKYKKPILLCDHQSSFATAKYPTTMWQQLETEEAAGLAYAKYLHDAFSRPYIIGYHRCQYIDRYQEWKGAGLLKQGLIQEDGTPYPTLAKFTLEANRQAVHRFQGHHAP